MTHTPVDKAAIYSDGFRHKNPTPAACRMGRLVMTGGIHGLDRRAGETPPGLQDQFRLTFENVRTVIEDCGGTPDDIIKMTFWLTDRAHRPMLNEEWLRMFPDAERRPARHVMRGNLDDYMLVQCDFTAVLPEGDQVGA